MKLDNMGVTRKLWLVILGLLIAMLAISVWSQMRSAKATDEAISAIEAFEANITMATRWRGMTETATTMVVGSAVTTDAALAQNYDTKVKDLIAQISQLAAAIIKNSTQPEDKPALDAITAARATVLGMLPKIKEIKASGDAAAVQAFVDKDFAAAIDRYYKSQDTFIRVQEQQRDAARAAAEQARRTAVMWALGAVLVVFAIGVALTVALVRSITVPLARAVTATDAIAGGDLTQQIVETRKDEFGHLMRSLGAMTTRLRELVTEVRGGVEQVSTASIEIANGNQDLSSRTEQTASNLQQTAASMEQLTSTVSQSADTARQANQLASTAAKAATQGGEIVAQVVRSMQGISDSSKKIADIIGVIDGIAFQTNILALNAAVEAARAGEQGRGFAVVASEVRGLAGRSAEAAKEIKALIGASVQSVESGSQQVAQAGESMGEIVSSVRRVSDLIGEISASSIEQRDGISQVNQAVNNLDQMTQQNAALVEESAAAASGLRDQAQRLSEVVSVFNVGTAARAISAPPRRTVPAPAPAARAAVAAPRARPATAARPAATRLSTPAKAPAKPAATSPRKPAMTALPPMASTPKAAPAKSASKSEEGDWESF